MGEEKGNEIIEKDNEVYKGNKLHVESSFLLKGEEFVYEIEKAPLYDDQKTIIGLLGIGNNITKRKKAEETLAKIKF